MYLARCRSRAQASNVTATAFLDNGASEQAMLCQLLARSVCAHDLFAFMYKKTANAFIYDALYHLGVETLRWTSKIPRQGRSEAALFSRHRYIANKLAA